MGKATSKRIANCGSKRRQQGATALEFGLTFPVFFAVFWAILSFGMVFTTRLTLQHAAEEGAREALRHGALVEDIACGGVDDITYEENLAQRWSRARNAACQQAAWLSAFATPEVDAAICTLTTVNADDEIVPVDDCFGSDPPSSLDCFNGGCQITVMVRYPYGEKPIIPSLPGFGVIAPESLMGTARITLDGEIL